MARLISRRQFSLRIPYVLAGALFAGCSLGTDGAPAEEEEQEKTPTAESDPNISLNISVGLVSGRVLFENRSGETLKNILVVMKERSGGNEFRHTIGIVPAFALMHFLPRIFKTADGTELDPEVHKVKDITVYADISSGRGRWYGSY